MVVASFCVLTGVKSPETCTERDPPKTMNKFYMSYETIILLVHAHTDQSKFKTVIRSRKDGKQRATLFSFFSSSLFAKTLRSVFPLCPPPFNGDTLFHLTAFRYLLLLKISQLCTAHKDFCCPFSLANP